MGYLMWGISSAAGAAAGNITFAVVAIAITLAAFAEAFVWRIGQRDRKRQHPGD